MFLDPSIVEPYTEVLIPDVLRVGLHQPCNLITDWQSASTQQACVNTAYADCPCCLSFCTCGLLVHIMYCSTAQIGNTKVHKYYLFLYLSTYPPQIKINIVNMNNNVICFFMHKISVGLASLRTQTIIYQNVIRYRSHIITIKHKNIKYTLQQTIKVQRASGGIAVFFL